MRIAIPSRVPWIIAAACMAVSLTLAFVVLLNGNAQATPGVSHGDGNSGSCVRSKKQIERNKHNAVNFYTVAFNDKDPERAVALYGGDEYIQHNPLADNGFDAFIAFVSGATAAFPDIHVDIRRVFAECDFVITHAVTTGAPFYGEFGAKVVDIFRMDAHGKVVEHWDVLALMVDPDTTANGNPEV
jgi:predicted SnoaL-like aldol condensation-catalyzing enzyme